MFKCIRLICLCNMQENKVESLHEAVDNKLDDKGEEKNMSKEFDDLAIVVAENTSVVSSAIALIEGFESRLASAGVDPTKLEQLRIELSSSKDALAAAVAKHTIAEEEPLEELPEEEVPFEEPFEDEVPQEEEIV